MDEKDKRIQELEAQLEKALAQIKELERRLNLNSSNSSKPPSSDWFGKQNRLQPTRKKGKNPSGGQKGHKGHNLPQTQNPTSIIRYPVDKCASCGNSLRHQSPKKIIKRQVFDIPTPSIEVIEHQAEVKICSCGHYTSASFPKDVTAHTQYGPRVQALAVYLSNQQLIPEDRLQQTFADLFSLPISTATLSEISRKFAATVTHHQENILDEIKKSSIKHLDETGFHIGGKTHWLHVISNNKMTHYRPSLSRKNLLDNVEGTVIHDHWKPYFCMENVQHSLCNAHHLRELKSLEEIEKESWAFQMSKLLKLLSHLTDPPYQRVSHLYDNIVSRGLAFHQQQPQLGGRKKRVGHNLLIRLMNFKDATLRFLTTTDCPFTNNQAEQDIRMMKVKQKISGGFRTMQGAEIFCTIRGFISTKRKQGINVFEAIVGV